MSRTTNGHRYFTACYYWNCLNHIINVRTCGAFCSIECKHKYAEDVPEWMSRERMIDPILLPIVPKLVPSDITCALCDGPASYLARRAKQICSTCLTVRKEAQRKKREKYKHGAYAVCDYCRTRYWRLPHAENKFCDICNQTDK